MQKLVLITVLSMTYSFADIAKKSIACDHPAICDQLRILNEKDDLHQIKPINLSIGDPHHFSLTSKQMKVLLTEPNLVLAPFHAHPWNKKIINLRKIGETTVLKFAPKDFNSSEKEHFWIFPKAYCHAFNQIRKRYFPQSQKECPYKKADQSLSRLKKALEDKLVVVTHAPIKVLLSGHGLNAFSLMSETDHDHGITSKRVKKLNDLLQSNPEVIWIEESQIESPLKIQKYLREKDTVLYINSYRPDVLSILIKKLSGKKK